MLKSHFTRYLRHLCNLCCIRDPRRCIQYLKNTLRSGNIGHKLVIEITDIVNWLPKHIQICPKGDKSAYRNLIHPQNHDTRIVQQNTAHTPRKVNHRSERITHAHRIIKRSSMFGKQRVKRLFRLFLRMETLDNSDSRHILMNKSV